MLCAVTPADRQQYLSMVQDFYSSEAVDHSVPILHAERTFDALLEGTPYAEGYMIYTDGQTAGYVLLAHTWSQEAGGHTVWVEELYILPQFRGQGLGTEVLAQVQKLHEGAARLRLEVAPANTKAQELYRRMGYEELDYRQMVQDMGCK